MATALELAEAKLGRIRKEIIELSSKVYEEQKKIPFGQPNIIGRKDIYAGIKKMHEKGMNLLKEEKEIRQRIEKLKAVETFKDENPLLKDVSVVGKSEYATMGAKTSVNNLDYFKDKLIKLELENEAAKSYNKANKGKDHHKTFGTEISSLKRKIANLESMVTKDGENKETMTSKTKSLIESGAVVQWKKKPIYYFVKGMKKVALVINEKGEFVVSNRYQPTTNEEKQFIDELLTSVQ